MMEYATCPRAQRLHGPLRFCPDCPEGDACELPRTPPTEQASADAMEAFRRARAIEDNEYYRSCPPSPLAAENAAAPLIQQYGDRRDAAGFRRGVEAAADEARGCWVYSDMPYPREVCEGIARHIAALLETQETSHGTD